jgi:preprotein translocase subunit SecE
MSQFVQYLKDTQTELKHVSWPTRTQAIAFTIIVILISIAVAAYLGALDQLFTFVVENFVL